MSEESVDVDSNVADFLAGRHRKAVTAASCPTRSASNVTEKYLDLQRMLIRIPFFLNAMLTSP